MNERQRHFRLRGHFVTRRIARYRYSAPSPARGPDALPQCKRKVHAGVLYEHGEPPFAGCRSHAAQTDVENDEGRIFEQVRYEPRFRGFRQFTFACLFSNPNTRVRLGLSSVSYPGFTGPRLAAPYAAFIATDCGGCSYDNPSVQVRDLRDGRIVSDLRWRMTTLPLTQEVRIADLELKPDGSVAWLAQFRYYDSARGGAANIVELTAVDANGRRLLDSSDAVVPDSLTLDGSTLTWVNAGVTHSATLD